MKKYYFGIGASIASFIFFFLLGYLSTYFSKYAQNEKVWKYINIFIIAFMSLLTIYIIKETLLTNLKNRIFLSLTSPVLA
jgi:L-lysine exporter family protein LysE/ArgO